MGVVNVTGAKAEDLWKLILYVRVPGSTWRCELAKEQKKTGLLHQRDVRLTPEERFGKQV